MLVKLKRRGTEGQPIYYEQYGFVKNNKVHYYDEEHSPTTYNARANEPIVKMNILWVNKDLKVSCKVASTWDAKVKGLQGTNSLSDDEGLFFPYEPRSDVTFHQGSVKFPLDILFLRDDEIVKIQAYTKVGSKETWSCDDCDGVLEVNGGFCLLNNVKVGDAIAIFASSQKDLDEYHAEKRANVSSDFSELYSKSIYSPNHVLHLMSEIADSI